ncbi:reverse transcriptase domain-containing protein [Tanacetum coccineum]
MPGEYAARRRDSNFEMVSSIDVRPRSVVARALRSGYYWPTMHRDARDMIKKCNDCQVHRPIPRQPQQELTPITSPWPFHKWGIDIAGPFPVAAGGLKFLIVAIDYFTKWIEAKAVATITGNQVKRFVWDNIVCRFGLPGEIVSDNGKQFCDNPFKDWREQAAIREEKAKLKMKAYYDAKVRGVSFRPGDFVYRANDASHAEDTGSWGPSGKDPTRLRKHLEKERTSCVTWMGMSCPARGISAISRNAIFSEVLTGLWPHSYDETQYAATRAHGAKD